MVKNKNRFCKCRHSPNGHRLHTTKAKACSPERCNDLNSMVRWHRCRSEYKQRINCLAENCDCNQMRPESNAERSSRLKEIIKL